MKNTGTQTRTWKWVVGVSLLALLLPAPARAGGKRKEDAPKNINLVWPVPPDKPRIKYVGSIYGAGDVEPAKKAGFLARLAGIEKSDIKPGFVKPYGIATDSKGRIYVSDSGQGLIFVLDTKNKKVHYLGRTPQLRLVVPIGISVDSKDRVWVADPVGQHVVAFDGEGSVLMVLGKTGEMVIPPTSCSTKRGSAPTWSTPSSTRCWSTTRRRASRSGSSASVATSPANSTSLPTSRSTTRAGSTSPTP